MADFKKQLLAVLQTINTSGSFVSEGAEPFVFPGMVVKGVGELSFPVPVAQVKELISRAHKAPFGKGAQTVLDTKVRSAWEIDAGAIRFSNKDWNAFVESVVDKAKTELGIGDRKVSANLYKLLIYEKGDFFLPHKDSEKEAGMFGSLIIGLPCRHEGGELLVQFDGKTHTVDFSGPAKKYQIPYAAFYADCVHEIRPIRSGYRLCLVYNLVLSKKKEKLPPRQLGSSVDRLAAILKASEEDKDIPKIVLLDHQYTPSNFTMEALKLHDRARAEALLRAAEQAGFYAKLALVTSYQIGELEEAYRSRPYGSRRSRRWYDDYDGDGEEATTDETMGEVFDSNIEIEHWMAGGMPPLRDLPLEEEDLISSVELNEGEPLQKNVTEYTGNAGMEMEYWYHYGAVMLWPRKYHYDLLQLLPLENKLEWIAYYNEHWKTIHPADVALTKKLVEHDLGIANSVEELNNDDDDDSGSFVTAYPSFLNKRQQLKLGADPLAQWLINLDDESYLTRKGEKILAPYFERISVNSWVSLFRKYPAFGFQHALTAAGRTGKLKEIAHLMAVLHQLHENSGESFDRFVRAQMEKLPAYLETAKLTAPNEKELTISILKDALALDAIFPLPSSWIAKTGQVFTRQPDRLFVNEILIGVLLETGKRSSLGDAILKPTLDDLKKRVAHKPQPPADWSRAVPASNSYDSKIWKTLELFLQSPTQQVFDYQKIQSERTHMEQAISHVAIDLRMETIRKGSPHTLRLIKTQAAYEKKLAEWNQDVDLLKRVEKKFG